MDKLTAPSKNHASYSVNAAMQHAAILLLASPVCAKISPRDKENLEEMARGEGFNSEYPSRRLYLNFCSDADTTSGFHGDTSLTFEYGNYGPEVDYRDGAEFHILDRSSGINWSSHGTQSTARAKVRAQLYVDLCEVIEKIEAETITTVEWLHRSAEEIQAEAAEQKALLAARAMVKTVTDAVQAVRSGMRVGSKREVPKALLADVKEGMHRVDIDGKHFIVTVNKFHPSIVRRSVLSRVTVKFNYQLRISAKSILTVVH